MQAGTAGRTLARPRPLDALYQYMGTAWIIYKALFRWFSPTAYIANKLILPIEQLVVFVLLGEYAGGRAAVPYVVVGNAIALSALGGLGVASTIGEERAQATLPLLLGSPANRLLNFLQRATVPAIDGLLGTCLALVIGSVLFNLDLAHANLATLTASVLAGVLSTVGMGCLLGVLALAFLDFYLVFNVVFLLLLVVSGVNLPPSSLPGWLQPVSHVVPLSRGIEAAHRALAGAPIGQVSGLLLGELGVGACYLVLGYLLLRRMEWIARRRGGFGRT